MRAEGGKPMRTKIATLIVFSCLSLFGVGCGDHGSSYYVVSTQPGTYEAFTLTLQNNTNMTLLPGPITADPYVPAINAPDIAPGGVETISIGFLPSSITVGATGVGAFSTFVYPATTLSLGVDYSDTAAGVTFVYH
jgi:hypothetical protein